jgi:hypothetical protein
MSPHDKPAYFTAFPNLALSRSVSNPRTLKPNMIGGLSL